MSKKMGVFLLCATASLMANVWAQSVGASPGYAFTIPAGEIFLFTNPFLEVSGFCTISMDPNHSTIMTGTVVRPTIIMDGVKYDKAGQSKSREIHHGDVFALSASYYSSVRLKNDGQYEIKAECRLG